jgi:hypothetical protein
VVAVDWFSGDATRRDDDPGSVRAGFRVTARAFSSFANFQTGAAALALIFFKKHSINIDIYTLSILTLLKI